MAEALLTALRVNLVLAGAVLLCLALRKPVRRWFGAHVAYGLWMVVPIAALTALLPMAPTRAARAPAAADEAVWSAVSEALQAAALWLPVLWIVGLAFGLGAMVMGQRAFLRREARGEAGPAVVGVITPRLVMPAWARQRFTEEERHLIRAHERAHMDREDPRVNALVAAAQVVLWFNPMIHVAAYYLRLDQELACDATVLARMPAVRRRYAETLLKTQLAASPLPLGCHWPARGAHPLEERIGALKASAPSANRRDIGIAAVVGVALLSCTGALAMQPTKVDAPTVHIVFVDITPSR